MPKVSKTKRFRGTPRWKRKLKHDFEEAITENSGASPEQSGCESDLSESRSSDSEFQDSVETASERKLANSTPSTSSVPYSDYMAQR